MNIFELIMHDTGHHQSSGLLSLQQNWQVFTNHLQTLQLGDSLSLSSVLKQANKLWSNILQQPVNIVKMYKEHYIYYLKQMIKKNLTFKLQKINTSQIRPKMKLIQSVNQIYQLFSIQSQYIQMIDDNNKSILHILMDLIRKILDKRDFGNNLKQIFQNVLSKHALLILKNDIIDFPEDNRSFIIEQNSQREQMEIQQNEEQKLQRLAPNQESLKQQQNELKGIFSKLAQMNLFTYYFESIQMLMIKNCQKFLAHASQTGIDGNETLNHKLLLYTTNYHKIFHNSFVKKISSLNNSNLFNQSTKQIQQSIYFLAAKLCSNYILEIVLDYPQSSHRLVVMLKQCLDKCNLLPQISQKLLISLKNRLLIPGINTMNILEGYLNTLGVLQIIDPHGTVFDKITDPIKNYLLRRNDTLRCIISRMTPKQEGDEPMQDLSKKFVKIYSVQYIDDQSQQDNEKGNIVMNTQQNKKRSVKYKQLDLATVLVNLYGSQEAFISQFQNMLAEKLMSSKMGANKDKSKQEKMGFQQNKSKQRKPLDKIDQLTLNIQQLKIRFGQNALQNCGIIMRDVRQSKKTDNTIHTEYKNINSYQNSQFKLQQLNCLAVSKGYWPISDDKDKINSFKLPQKVQNVFNQYAAGFSKLKTMRKLYFHNNLGYVNLTLSFKNGDFKFTCLPIHAVIIECFDQQKLKNAPNGLSPQQLSNALNIPLNILKQKISFWVHKEVIKQIRPPKTGLSLKRLNSIEQREPLNQPVMYKPVDQYVASKKQQMDDADGDQYISRQNNTMQSHQRHIIQGLILSILGTNGPKSSEKIHLLLKTVYKTDLDYNNYQETQTVQILKKMVQKKKISFNGELYSKISR